MLFKRQESAVEEEKEKEEENSKRSPNIGDQRGKFLQMLPDQID